MRNTLRSMMTFLGMMKIASSFLLHASDGFSFDLCFFMTHRNIFVFAPSDSTVIDVDAIPPAASRADAKNNTLIGIVDDMS